MNMHSAAARASRLSRFATDVSPAAIALLLVGATAVRAQTATPPADAGPSASPAASAAQAGTPPGAEDGRKPEADAIVVTGFRQSLRNAIDSKRLSDRVVETISAEDIGKLPDNSIAESLARLPGITTQRLDGRAQVISIRGFAPDFSTTLLNGREQVSTGDTRSVEYDQYPSEVISKVSVYKTPDASLVGQGLSGTVDLETIHPLSYGKRVLAASARGEINDNGKLNSGTDNKGYRVSGIYVDQFMDNRIGVTLGVAYEDSPTQIKRFNSWGYPSFDCFSKREYYTTDAAGAKACNPAYTAAIGKSIIGGSKSYIDSTDLQRTGVNAAIEFRASDHLRVEIDGFYSHFRDDQVLRGVELPLYYGGGGVTRPEPYLLAGYTVTGDAITNGQFANVKGVQRNDANRRESDLYAIGANAAYKDESWNGVIDASYSGTKRKELILETYTGSGRIESGVLDTIGFAQNGQGAIFSHQLNYSDPAVFQLTSPQGWGGNIAGTNGGPGIINGQEGYYNNRKIKDDLYALRGSLERRIDSPLSAVQIGVNYTDRKKSLAPDEFFLGLKTNTDGLASAPVPANALLSPSYDNFVGLGPLLSYDPIGLVNSGIFNLVRNPNADVAAKSWSVHERITSGWIMGRINATLGATKLTGNFGVQIQNADQRGSGTRATGAPAIAVVPFSEGANYTDVLPSLNLSLRLPSDFVLRLGAARQLIRPRLDDMNPSITYSFSQANNTTTFLDSGGFAFGGTGGNARLRPWRANAVDLTAEKYFGKDGYIAVALFYKDLVNYTYTQTIIQDFTGVPVPGGFTPLDTRGYVQIQQNGQGGNIYGIEASGTLPLGLFSHALDGFGLTGSFSYTQNSIQPNGPGSKPESLPGYSKYVTNITGFYERGGFSIRGSVSDRSSYTGELTGFGGGRERRLAQGEAVVDTQVGYEFKDGRVKGLGILFQGQNLTDEPFATFNPGHGNQIIDYQRFGRRFLFGASFKY